MRLPRVRQVALAAARLAPVAERLQQELDLSDPFHDEGVGHFGLENAVFTAGDTFLEIVAPTRDGTAAGRYLERRGGDCGYMAMFQVADAAAARKRLADVGVRVVHETEHPDIVDIHLHPKDVPGAIVALDACSPEGSWRWGGPEWKGRVPAHGPGGIVGVTVAAADPVALEERWSAVVGAPVAEAGVRFVQAADAAGEGIIGVTVAVSGPARTVDVCGVRFDLVPVE